MSFEESWGRVLEQIAATNPILAPAEHAAKTWSKSAKT